MTNKELEFRGVTIYAESVIPLLLKLCSYLTDEQLADYDAWLKERKKRLDDIPN